MRAARGMGTRTEPNQVEAASPSLRALRAIESSERGWIASLRSQ